MVLAGHQLRSLGVIKPYFLRTEIELGGIKTTFGESMAGYDLRLNKVSSCIEQRDGGWVLMPGQFALASAMERFQMPNDLIAFVHDKSSWARRGLAVQNTVIEPGWHGYLTLELTNHGDRPILLIPRMGICQVVFHRLEQPAEPYDGKYQGQGPDPQPAI